MVLLMLWLWAGQETIANGLTPAQNKRMTVALDLTLGADDQDDRQIFSNRTRVAVDGEGALYILDAGNYRVAVFDKNGRFIRQFGKQGEGPGEFRRCDDIRLSPTGDVAVVDTGRKQLFMFSPTGEFIRQTSLAPGFQLIYSMSLLDNGHTLIGAIRQNARFQQTYDLSLYDGDMKLVKTIDSVRAPERDWSRMQEPGFWADFLKDQFEGYTAGIPAAAQIDGNTVIHGRSDLYKGEIIDQTGAAMTRFTKEYKPKAFTEAAQKAVFTHMWQTMVARSPRMERALSKSVFEKAMATAEPPPRVSPIAGLCRLGDGFAVLTGYDAASKTGQLDAFDRTGRYVARGDYRGPDRYLVGSASHIYTVDVDERDNIVVLRYRVDGH